jgi:hypothetical protein
MITKVSLFWDTSSTAVAVDEVFEKINFAQCGVIVGATAKNLFFKPR